MCYDARDVSAVCDEEQPGLALRALVCLHSQEWLFCKWALASRRVRAGEPCPSSVPYHTDLAVLLLEPIQSHLTSVSLYHEVLHMMQICLRRWEVCVMNQSCTWNGDADKVNTVGGILQKYQNFSSESVPRLPSLSEYRPVFADAFTFTFYWLFSTNAIWSAQKRTRNWARASAEGVFIAAAVAVFLISPLAFLYISSSGILSKCRTESYQG